MRLLILGGTQFIGKEIACRARAAGHEVLLFNRGVTDASGTPPAVRGDVDELPAQRRALRALEPDAVVHCIAYTEQHARDCVEVFEGLATRLLILGSQDCYELFDQTRQGFEVGDFPVDEDSPTARRRFYWKGTSHSRAETYDKNLMTDVFLDAHEDGRAAPTVFRLPMVYGPGDPQFAYRHGDLLWHVLDRRELLVLGAVEQSTLWTFGYVENIAAGVLHALEHACTIGRVYNLGELFWRTKRRWAELYAAAGEHAFEIRSVPDALLREDADPDRPAPHLLMSSARFSQETGFEPPVPIEDAIARTLAFAREHPDALGERPDYEARERRLATFRKNS